MKNKYQEEAIKLSGSQAGPKMCSTCGAPCAECAQKDESGSSDERFNETDMRSTGELMEGKNKMKGGRFEER